MLVVVTKGFSTSHTDTHSVDGADWDAQSEINTFPDAGWVAGPVDNGCGIGARQGPGGTRRGWWPEEEACGLFETDSCRHCEVEECMLREERQNSLDGLVTISHFHWQENEHALL